MNVFFFLIACLFSASFKLNLSSLRPTPGNDAAVSLRRRLPHDFCNQLRLISVWFGLLEYFIIQVQNTQFKTCIFEQHGHWRWHTWRKVLQWSSYRPRTSSNQAAGAWKFAVPQPVTYFPTRKHVLDTHCKESHVFPYETPRWDNNSPLRNKTKSNTAR